MSEGRAHRYGTWLFVLAHQPVSFFWLLLLIIAVGGSVSVVMGSATVWEIAGALSTTVLVTELVARSKGVSAWPTRRWLDAMRDAQSDRLNGPA